MFVLRGMTARAVPHFQQALAINAELGSPLASLKKRSEAVPRNLIGYPSDAAGIPPLLGYH